MELPESLRQVLKELETMSRASSDLTIFCEEIVSKLQPEINVDVIVVAKWFDEQTFDVVFRSNRAYARLDEDRFLKIHRLTPLTDAIRSQKTQALGTTRKILREYPEALTWPVIPRAVVAVPIVESGRTVAAVVFGFKVEFSTAEQPLLCEVSEEISALIYLMYLKQSKQEEKS